MRFSDGYIIHTADKAEAFDLRLIKTQLDEGGPRDYPPIRHILGINVNRLANVEICFLKLIVVRPVRLFMHVDPTTSSLLIGYVRSLTFDCNSTPAPSGQH